MKFIITAKNPDSIEDSVRRAAEEMTDVETEGEGMRLTAEERKDTIEERTDQLWDACAKWVEYKEYIRIIVDTEKGTATVCEV